MGGHICDAALAALLVIVIYTDWRYHKIYNWSTFGGMALGLTTNAGFEGWPGAQRSLVGIAVGLALQIVPFALSTNLVKGGDVKLLMMVGGLEGWEFTLWGFLYGAALFGVVAIYWLARDRTLRPSLANIYDFLRIVGVYRTVTAPAVPANRRMVPWGCGLALGFVTALVLKYSQGTASLPFVF